MKIDSSIVAVLNEGYHCEHMKLYNHMNKLVEVKSWTVLMNHRSQTLKISFSLLTLSVISAVNSCLFKVLLSVFLFILDHLQLKVHSLSHSLCQT